MGAHRAAPVLRAWALRISPEPGAPALGAKMARVDGVAAPSRRGVTAGAEFDEART